MSLFSEADRQRIEEAVRALEQRSATELVVAVLPRSDDYAFGRALVAGAWSLAVVLGLLHFVPELSPIWAVLCAIPVAAATFVLFGTGPLARLTIPAAQIERAVSRRAFELFARHGVHATRARTGMLVLISELEHRVVILGDRGIHERVGDAGWQAHVDHVVAAIRRGDAVTGVLEVIERIGRVHAELLPAGPANENELPDDVVRG